MTSLGGTITEIEAEIEGLSGAVDTRVIEINNRIDAVSGLAENAYEVQIGTAETPTENIKIVIDTEADASTQIYTKEQIDAIIEALRKDLEDNILIGKASGATSATEIVIDTDEEGDSYEVYTRSQVNALIADLQRQIDELRP